MDKNLGGSARLPPATPVTDPPPQLPDMDLPPELVAQGKAVYYRRCIMCHGDTAISGRLMPDLRLASAAVHERWDAIVLEGERKALGMPGFKDALSVQESHAVHAYVVSRAQLAIKNSETATRP